MRAFLISLSLLALTACAANGPQGQGEGLPPPGFPVSQPLEGQICGDMRQGSQSCPAEQYCHREISAICGAADAPGVCRTRPDACTMDYNPVCGCDGKTYSNECVANSQGVSASAMGPCQ